MRVTAKIPTPTCLYLVRHGETEWSLSGRHTGRTDIALTERGKMPTQVSDRADRLIARLRAFEGNVALFSHGQFGCVLAARWIGLPPVEAQHFTLDPASLSILGFGFHHPEVAVIALWNAASSEKGGLPHSLSAETKAVNPCALEQWENEGGEIEAEAVRALRKENAG